MAMVQTILNGTFRQRVHGPPAGKRPFMPPPPPGPHRAWFTVNGAGTAKWNGNYSFSAFR